MSEKPNTLYLLITLWALLGAIFIILGVYSLELSMYILSTAAFPENWSAMLFFEMFFLTTSLLIFGGIFLIFSYETFRVKSWVWDAGIIISTIFIVIFSFMLASTTLTTLIYQNDFAIQTLIAVMISLFVDLGIVFLITRPSIKVYMHDVR